MKALIVDDNADDRRFLRANLEHHGCEVIEAAGGLQGLDAAKKQKPDLIISDALMPHMDGFQFLRAVKTDHLLKTIPFIFYSATYTETDDVNLAISLGAEAFIIKPKESGELWDEIKGLIENFCLKKEAGLTAELIGDDEEYLNRYSQIVAAKLEKKVKNLEDSLALLRKTEAELLTAKAEWEWTFDAIEDPIMILDAHHRLIKANKAMAAKLGVAKSEAVGLTCYEHVHGTDRPPDFCPHVRLLADGNPHLTEIYEERLGGYFHVSVYPLHDTDGKLYGSVHIARDISERKKTEDKLKQSEEFNRNILQSVGEGFVVIDRDYRIISANRTYCEQLKLSCEDIVGRHCYEVSHHLDSPCFQAGEECAPKRTFETGAPEFVIHTHYAKDGTPVYVETRSFPMKDENGNVSAVIETLTNISEKRSLEEQLRHTQKMEAIGTLAGGIAHDFNNILNVIIGYGGLMQMKMKPDDQMMPQLKEILAAGERAAHLTKGLLTFSRKQTMEVKIVNLNEIIEGLKKMLGRIIGEDIELCITLHPSVSLPNGQAGHLYKRGNDRGVIVKADVVQIEQVLMNLAANARDAMPKGGTLSISAEAVRIDSEFIKAHHYGESGRYALVTVSDTGAGMDEKTRKRIFEPYFTTKEMGRGTGLGLSIVYGIVKQHKGYINCYSEPGKGTTFRIYLPLAKEKVEGIKAESEILTAGGNEMILLAEDDPSVRMFLKDILSEYGYTVIEAVDGEEAVARFRENKDRIELLLFDIIMPKKNGKEVYEDIKGIRHDIRTLFISGYARDIVQKFGIEDEVDFISKPVSPTEFLRKVREALDR